MIYAAETFILLVQISSGRLMWGGSVSAAHVVVLDLGLCCTYPHLIGLASAPEVAQQILLHHIWPRTAFHPAEFLLVICN